MKLPLFSIVSFLLVGATVTAIADPKKKKDRYWEWGVAVYGAQSTTDRPDAPTTDLDLARQDWIYLVNSGPDATTVPAFNRFLAINPNLKILVRLWPINNTTNRRERRHKATFLDYLYTPGVKEKIFANIKKQVDYTLVGLSNPDAVVGFHFLEELPYNFAGNEIDLVDKLSDDLIYHQKSIEAERGKPLVWDEETRRWWAEKWVQVQNEINAYIKELTGKPVFVYYQANTRTLDFLDKNEPVHQRKVLPFRYSDVVKPGVADGFFAYPVNEKVWKRFLDLSSRHNWPFFSQLAHPGGMRLESWEKTIELVKTRHPNNLGTFIYCEGHCHHGLWNDDPAITPDDNANRYSITSHYRRILADLNVGMEIVARNMQPRIEVEYDLKTLEASDYLKVTAVVFNQYDSSWRLGANGGLLKDAEIELELPGDYKFEDTVTAPRKLKLGDIPAGADVRAVWYARAGNQREISENTPLKIHFRAKNAEPLVQSWTGASSIIAPNLTRTFKGGGEYWPVSLYHVKVPVVVPVEVTLECIGDPCTNPTLTNGNKRTIYQGVLRKGDTLVLRFPEQKAVLKNSANPEGIDVSDRLASSGFAMAGYRIIPVSYTDDDPPSIADKLRITINPINTAKQ